MKKLLVLSLSMMLATSAALADNWPSKPIKYIVPFGPGGSTDTLSRVVIERLNKRLGQPLVVENIGGVGGSIGMTRLSRAEPDGYTIGLGNTATHAITPNIQPTEPYDPVNGFTPITLLSEYSNILVVNSALPVNTLAEFIALAKISPKPISYGSSGIGSSNHLTSELLSTRTNIKFTHIPFKGNSEAMTAVAAGHVDSMFATVGEALAFIASGKVKALGTSDVKVEDTLPNVPPISTVVPGFKVVGWMALFAPAKLPDAIADRLNKEVVEILRSPDVAERYKALGLRPASASRSETKERVSQEYQLWKAVSKDAGVRQ